MVTIVSKVRCLLRIDSNIGRRKVDAPRRIFNEKEEGALRKGLIAGLAISCAVPGRVECAAHRKTSRTSSSSRTITIWNLKLRESFAIWVCSYLTCSSSYIQPPILINRDRPRTRPRSPHQQRPTRPSLALVRSRRDQADRDSREDSQREDQHHHDPHGDQREFADRNRRCVRRSWLPIHCLYDF
jgi:hypothetical protein